VAQEALASDELVGQNHGYRDAFEPAISSLLWKLWHHPLQSGINGCRSPAWGPFGVGPAPPPPPKLNVRPSALLSFVNTLPTGLPIGHGIVRCILVTTTNLNRRPIAKWHHGFNGIH
jgi:hypothetical protein